MFSQYCQDKYSIEYCEVQQPDGTINLYPELAYRDEVVSVNKANEMIGIRYILSLWKFYFTKYIPFILQ